MRARVFALVLAGSLLSLTACGSGSSSNPPTHSSTPTVGASPLSDDAKVKVVAWFSDKRHHEGMQALDHDLSAYKRMTVLDPVRTDNFHNIRDTCGDLDHDVPILKAFGPIPDPQTQALWTSTLTNIQQGVTDCLASLTDSTGSRTDASNTNTTQLAKAKAEITKGDTDYGALADRVGDVLGVRTPSPGADPTSS
ncbi:hypothetical protein P8A22_00095 [Streptomyces laculatispora]|uniref:Lipoprotein n=1 Tax=Streptomyces laculatispora TaxID=887464 RepID=A0ABY9HVJ4_9ACTN|nr:hypothetical protein [Streptomyces laculatispora]WLQ38598.1 hypothetical protein P8A22_00095 [Streptomyces laculatispora]